MKKILSIYFVILSIFAVILLSCASEPAQRPSPEPTPPETEEPEDVTNEEEVVIETIEPEEYSPPAIVIETNVEEPVEYVEEVFFDMHGYVPYEFGEYKLELTNEFYTSYGYTLGRYFDLRIIPQLEEWKEALKRQKGVVVIAGHANSDGSENPTAHFMGNVQLSKERALAVLNYLLLNSSLDESYFIIEYYGSSKPLMGTDPQDYTNICVIMYVDDADYYK